jgi:hypothetical protein
LKLLCWILSLSIVCCFFPGCKQAKDKDTELFVVDLKKDSPLTYKMVSQREIRVDLDPSGKMSKGKKDSGAWEMTETLEITAQITLKEIDSDGYLVIEAYYPEVKVQRKGKDTRAAKDAVENLANKKAVFKITPAGVAVEDSGLVQLIQQLGDASFSGSAGNRENVKNQDMIADFVALQWFMFDPISKIEDPLEGVKKGQSWKSELPVPAPLEMAVKRDTTYTLENIYAEDDGQKALITSAYSLADNRPKMPLIYSGRAYQQRGFFGVLRCKPLSLTGGGQFVYNLDRGVIEKNIQEYDLETTAILFIPLPGTEGGRMKIHQKLTVELLKD